MSFRALRSLALASWHLTREAACEARRAWPGILISGVLVALLVLWLMPQDRAVLEQVQSWTGSEVRPLCKAISFCGEFLNGCLFVAVFLALFGWLLRRPSLRQAALACLLAAASAGIAVNCFRLTLGRPRPSSNLPDGFYGLQASAAYHSFPSGHSATAFGTGSALAFLHPPFAFPVLLLAASVGWSRMELDRHYLSDVVAGGWLGCVAGFLYARAVRRRGSTDCSRS
jgi:membrane-associated phospholipid phosphatase